MNRQAVFAYVMVQTAGNIDRLDAPPKIDGDALAEKTLRRFLEVFPGRPAESVYERLCRTPDRAAVAAFSDWLAQRRQATQNTPGAEHYRWATYMLANPMKIEHRPAVEPARAIVRPSAAQALSCVQTLLGLEHGAPAPADFRRSMVEVIAAWDNEVSGNTEDGACPDCGDYHLELDAAAHAVCCSGHGAIAQLEAARESARALGTPHDEDAVFVLPKGRWPAYGQAWEAEAALDIVLKVPNKSPLPPKDPLGLLLRVATEWAHYVDRSTDPCPWCGVVLALTEVRPHLRTCEEHPAAKLARRILSRAKTGAGLEALIFDRIVCRRELSLLAQATATYDASMGWTGDAAYSKVWSERPWRAAFARAGKFLGVPEHRVRVSRPPSAVRDAMARLLTEGSGPVAQTIADIGALRSAAAELDAWVEAVGFATTCPACKRKGVLRAELPRHLETCPLHPAVRNSRGAEAIRVIHGDTSPSAPRAFDENDPDHYRDRGWDYFRKEQDAALARLFEFEASELTKEDRERVSSFVANWEEMLSAKGPCPWCGEAARSDEHLLQCLRHPRGTAEAPPQGDELVAVRLRLEADRCAVALARLHEACHAFWNGMSDGEDGKSISNDRIEDMLKEAREEAATVLAAIPERPSVCR